MSEISTRTDYLCPFHQNPYDDCYCNKMNSQDIEKTTMFCINNFENCLIYANANRKMKKMSVQ